MPDPILNPPLDPPPEPPLVPPPDRSLAEGIEAGFSCVVILNRHGAALAAGRGRPGPSARGARTGRRDRRRLRAEHQDTIFDFSYSEPAALMVHGRATLADQPWASVVDLFRAGVGQPTTLSGLAKEFAAWLAGTDDLDRAAVLRSWEDTLYSYLIEEWSPSAAIPAPLPGRARVEDQVLDRVIERLHRSGDATGLQEYTGQMREWLAVRAGTRPWSTLVVVGYDVEAPAPTMVRITISGLVGGRLVVEVEPPRTPVSAQASLVVGAGEGQADPAGAVVSGLYGEHLVARAQRQESGVDGLLADVFDTLAPLRTSLLSDDQRALRQALLQVHDRIRRTHGEWQRAWDGRLAELLRVHRGLAQLSPSALAAAAQALLQHARLRQSLIEGMPSPDQNVQFAVLSRAGGYDGPGPRRESGAGTPSGDRATATDLAADGVRAGSSGIRPSSGRRASWVRIGA